MVYNAAMDLLAVALIVFVAFFHVQVFVMEALLWKTPRARKAFNTTAKTAEITYPLAINQGVYNLFLAAGLLLSFLLDDPARWQAQMFFLSCVVVAAVTAGLVVSKRIMLLQGLPALLGLILVITSN
jgi:putative membrane protein